MKIGFLLPTLFASKSLFPNRIFAPGLLARDMINSLVGKGHQVTVFASPDFVTKGQLVAGDIKAYQNKLNYHKLYRISAEEAKIRNDEVWKRSFEISVSVQAYRYAREHKLDIVHSYHDFLFTPHYLADLTQIPTVYTIHDPLPPGGSFEYHEFEKFAHHNYVSISNSQRQSTLKLNFIDTVYHGIDIDSLSFNNKDGGYLLFMGRLTREKGLHNAIQVAIKTNHKLEIGTNFPDFFQGDKYFETEIKPFLDNPLIHEPGMAKGEYKTKLYRNARALLFPIEWEEPFGMVMIEAMACGTPVIAYNRGSVPEVVRDGVTGFIVDDDNTSANFPTPNSHVRGTWVIKKKGIEGLIEAVNRIGEIDRAACRKHVEENFTLEKMVEGYERVYKKLVFRS